MSRVGGMGMLDRLHWKSIGCLMLWIMSLSPVLIGSRNYLKTKKKMSRGIVNLQHAQK